MKAFLDSLYDIKLCLVPNFMNLNEKKIEVWTMWAL